MRTSAWSAIAAAPLLCLTGCTELFGPGTESIAGFYWLRSVDAQALPCCASHDSTGATVTLEGANLYLGEAAPEPYTYTPAGVALPSSCVHEIPDGAYVDTARVVHLPNGSSYSLPPCGSGSYRLAFIRQYAFADGGAHTVVDSAAGRYSWSTPADGVRLITLVGSGLGGAVELSSRGTVIRVAPQHVGPPDPTRHDPEYRFVAAGEI